MSGWAVAAQIAGEVGTAWLNANSQHNANRMNLRLQREQQAWEQMMANTAIQRRAADIEKAGGNRALAFVNGQGADTPSIQPARMEAVRLNAPNIGSALMMKQQLENMRAQTAATNAAAASTAEDARAKKRDNDLMDQTTAWKEARVKEWVEAYDRSALTTAIMRNQETSSAAEARRLEQSVDAAVRILKQQAEEGQINLDALRNWAAAHGLEAQRAVDMITQLLDSLPNAKKIGPTPKGPPIRLPTYRPR